LQQYNFLLKDLQSNMRLDLLIFESVIIKSRENCFVKRIWCVL